MVASSPVWEVRSLREVVTKLVDGSHNPPPKQDTGLPMLSARNIDRGQVLFDDYRLISESAFVSENARTRIAPGDVLLTIVGTIGRTAVVPEGSQPFSLQRSVAVLTPVANLLPKFLCYQLQSPAIQRHFEANARGTAQKGVYLKTLGQTPVVLPPVDVQREIVAELEKQFSRLDEAVANLQRVKANLKRYKASVLKAAVEGHLVETEASLAHREGRTYETGEQLLQRILDERRAKWNGKGKYKEPLPLDTNGIGTTPEGWGWAAVEVICESIVDCPHSTAKFQPNGYPCVDTTWMTTEGLVVDRARFVDEATYLDRISRLAPKPGDIVFAREGTIGTAVLIPDRMTPCLGQRVMLLRASQEYLNGLLVHVLHSEVVKSQYRAQALGSTVAHINVGDVKRFAVPVPPLAEQVRILAEVDRHLSIIREVEAEVDANLQRAQALRQSVLARAFLEGVK
jgi:type I restriction enzyme S subunit